MWARTVEVMLACWLGMSPFIFAHPQSRTWWWATDFGCAVIVSILSCLSFWPPLKRMHLLIIVPAFWLIGFGWYAHGRPAPPALQNDIIVGLLLLMTAILPIDIVSPPRRWREWNGQST